MAKSQLEKFERMLGYGDGTDLSDEENQEKERIIMAELPPFVAKKASLPNQWFSTIALVAASLTLVMFFGSRQPDPYSSKGRSHVEILVRKANALVPLAKGEAVEPLVPFVIKYFMNKGERIYFGFFDSRGTPLTNWHDVATTGFVASGEGHNPLGGTYKLDDQNVEESIVVVACPREIPLHQLQVNVHGFLGTVLRSRSDDLEAKTVNGSAGDCRTSGRRLR